MPAIHDLEAWAPLLGVTLANDADGLTAPGSYGAGHVGRRASGFFSSTGKHLPPLAGVADKLGFHPVTLVQDALAGAGMDSISYVAQFSPDGRLAVCPFLSDAAPLEWCGILVFDCPWPTPEFIRYVR